MPPPAPCAMGPLAEGLTSPGPVLASTLLCAALWLSSVKGARADVEGVVFCSGEVSVVTSSGRRRRIETGHKVAAGNRLRAGRNRPAPIGPGG